MGKDLIDEAKDIIEEGKEEKKLYMDGYLRQNLKTVKHLVERKDWDFVFLIDGMEGSGKSVFAQQVAYHLDPSLTIDRICFEADDFKEQIIKAEKNQAVIFDEAYRGLSSRRAMSNVNYIINAMMMEIRQKNLYIFVVLPSFFHLDSIIALHRSRALFHITVNFDKMWERGYFAAFNYDRKKSLYLNGKKFHTYSVVAPNFIGRFTKQSPIDWEKYKEKKALVLKRLGAEDDKERKGTMAKVQTHQRGVLMKILKEDMNLTYKDITSLVNKYSKEEYTIHSVKNWMN